MPGNDLTNTFIANTYQNLVQKPDLTKEEYYNGIGQAITVINRDAIGTVKMFYPPNLVLSSYFNNLSGEGLDDWEGWALCDGRNGTPDLRGRFIAGYTYLVPGDTSTNSQRNENAFALLGKAGAGKNTGDYTAEPVIDIDNLPPHRHKAIGVYLEDGNSYNQFAHRLGNDGDGNGIKQQLDNANYFDNNVAQIDNYNNLSNSGSDESRIFTYNTGRGLNNIGGQGNLKSTPDNFYPAYVALVYVMRVS